MHRYLLLALSLAGSLALVSSSACSSDANDCSDGEDNDGDSLIDEADPGCALNGDSESPDPVVTACSDGLDNDGDTKIDLDDEGCASPTDDDEEDLQVAACNDGVDNDGDALVDFPADPGCGTSLKDDETDDCPSGEDCPACGNGVDDDGDTFIDYPDDPDCQAAADPSEQNANAPICMGGLLPLALGEAFVGTIDSQFHNTTVSSSCGGLGRERGFEITVESTVALEVTTNYPETTIDTVVYLQGECGNTESELACNDDTDDASASSLIFDNLAPGTYVLVVDSHVAGAGDFKVTATAFPALGAACTPSAQACAPTHFCRSDDGVSGTCEIPTGPLCTDSSGILRELRTPGPGQLRVTELLPTPTGSFIQEWFELRAMADVDINGLGIGKTNATAPLGTTVFSLDNPETCMEVAAGTHLLFARSASAASNGGLPTPDFIGSTILFALDMAATNDGIAIFTPAGDVIDFLSYSTSTAGVSISEDPSGTGVCPGTGTYGTAANQGTPKAANPNCP